MQPNDRSLCAQVRAFLQHGAGDESLTPPAEFVAHAAACESCRGALGLIAAALAAAPAPIDCDACQADMAAFIDCEHAHGFFAAFARFPAVGWHLWHCADCAETYQLTRALLDAEARGALAPLPLPAAPLRLPAIRLARAFLNLALPPPLALRPVLRGADANERVLYAETLDRRQVVVSVARQPDDDGTLVVSLLPGAPGVLRLRLGGHAVSAPFDAAGRARVAGLPAALLDAPNGPELLIEIELTPTAHT